MYIDKKLQADSDFKNSQKYKITRLDLSWSISKGRETYGYNIARLDDATTKKRFKCMGGGYDMIGTCFGNWLAETYQERLLAIKEKAFRVWSAQLDKHVDTSESLYGMTHYSDKNVIDLDGGCGIQSMIKIAEAIGLEVQSVSNKKGQSIGFIVSEELTDEKTA